MERRKFILNTALLALMSKIYSFPKVLIQQTSISDDDLRGMSDLSFQNPEIKLRAEAYEAFLKMKEAAVKDGIDITAVSAYRSFADQKRIWNRKYKNFTNDGLTPMASILKIIEYSTIPGTSRHHWGTDIDIIDMAVPTPKYVLNTEHFKGNGIYTKLKQWMDANSNKFEFYLVYTDDPNRNGFKYEPWHYSYAPLSKEYLKIYRERSIIKSIDHLDILGATELTKTFLEQYYAENILDINHDLL